MVDYNLGEQYADKFVSVKNEPLYDFNEFSYFGKDYLWTLPTEDALYDKLQNALSWVRTHTSTPNRTPTEDKPETPVKESVIEEPIPEQSIAVSSSQNSQQTTSTIGNFNVDKAIERLHYLTQFKLNDRYNTARWTKKNPYRSGSYCARAVSLAMEAGGLKTNWRPNYAGEYGPKLIKNGWKQLSDDVTDFKRGDVCVINGLGSKGHGHISMFDGKQWVSDFYQNSWDVYHGQSKRGKNAKFYRYKG